VKKRRLENYRVLIPAGIYSLNIAVILWILTWPSGAEPRLPIEPRFQGDWRLPSKPVKLLTFNVGFGKELDKSIDLIKQEDPDIVCLQELLEDQVGKVEKGLGMTGCWFHSSNHGDTSGAGKALFTRGRLSEPQTIPNPKGGSFGVWAAVEIHGGRFLAGSIHLMDLKAPRAGYPARNREIEALVDAGKKVGAPALFAGDFNNPPTSVNYDLMTKHFIDLGKESGPTHASRLPILRVDYVFGTREWEPLSVKTIKTTLSDHYPVVVVVQPSGTRSQGPEKLGARSLTLDARRCGLVVSKPAAQLGTSVPRSWKLAISFQLGNPVPGSWEL
jgi:endonuclease/exonuclease/phosphatase family metal-dependent hydrolase